MAGSSCVDYSSLNNHRKTFGQSGESYSTLTGILGYAKRYTPRIVILENVVKAPWANIEAAWQDCGYVTHQIMVDTKNYSIPHTRVRGYMIGLHARTAEDCNLDSEKAVIECAVNMGLLQRRCSTSFMEFLLHENDRQLQQDKREMSIKQQLSKAAQKFEWDASLYRYMNLRLAHRLGFVRPFLWRKENGSILPPDFSWIHWLKGQVERVWECIEIAGLRFMSDRDYDMSSKWSVVPVNFSWSVD